MYLSKLEIQGFKSFKDKEILEFPEGLSAIIGPNGSGKTNVVDAICFVLGSSRNLRVKRLEELIYQGGKGEKVSKAKVSLYLKENGKKRMIKISREINREGKSEYYLDGKKVLREEILDLVGENEYNIIQQNDVTKIIDMKPEERREVIDDLCGLREYEQKKEKAIKELEKVEEKISTTNIILGEKKGYLQGLKEERDEAIRYREIKEKLEKCRATIIKYQLDKEKEAKSRIREKVEKLQKEKDEKLVKLKRIKEEIAEKTEKVKKFNQKIFQLEEKGGSEEFSHLREELVRKEEKREHLRREQKEVERETSEKEKRKKELKEEKEKLLPEINKIQEEIKKIKPEIDKLGKPLQDLKKERKLQELKSEEKWWKNVKSKDEEEIEKGKKEEKIIEEKVRELLSKKKELLKKYKQIKEEEEKLNKSLEEKRKRVREIVRKIKEIEPFLDEEKEKLTQKKTELESIRRAPSRGVVAKTIMRIKPVVKGIYGIAQELGIPEKKYEKALTIAGGGRLYAIGVENEDTAKKCIDYLRKNKIGRATFLPINKLKIKVKERAPKEAIGFARDFIKCSEKIKPIFEWVFGDTLIVKNLDTAKKIGIGKWRMVTLEGDLISPGGAITGGYLKSKKVFSTEGEIKKEIFSLEKKIVSLRNKLEEEKNKLNNTRKEVSKMGNELQEKNTIKEKIKINLESIEERFLELKKKKEEVSRKISSLKDEIEKSKKKIKKIEDEIKEGEKEKAFTKRKDSLEELKRKEKKYNELITKESSFQEKDRFLSQRIKEIGEEIKELNKRRRELLVKEKKVQEEFDIINKKVEKKKREAQGIEKEINELMASKNKLEKEISSLGEKAGTVEYELEKYQEKLNRYSIKEAKVETKLLDLEKEFKEYKGVDFLEGKKISELEKRADELGREIAGFGFINMRAIENYDLVKKEMKEINEKLETLEKEKKGIYDFMKKVERKKKEIFMETFREIKRNFEDIFKELGGGKGTLKLDNKGDISKAGLIIKASPGGKKLINLDVMSGGEKVLTCAAFLLAIQRYKPSYFYILDELDAALDKNNSLKLAEMLKESKAQFILVTHNNTILEYAKTVIGVSMQDGLSQVVGVKLGG